VRWSKGIDEAEAYNERAVVVYIEAWAISLELTDW
jgi:hypothetical protein